MLFSGKIYGQESFNLNISASTPSNDGNYCGRVIFTVVNDNNFPVEIELWQKTPGASTFTSPGTTTTINANGTIGINSSFAATAGSYSYYAVFTKIDGSILSNTSLTPINVIVYPRPVAGNITGASQVCVGLTNTLSSNATGGSGGYTISWLSSLTAKGIINSTGILTGVESGTTNISYSVTDIKGCVSPSSASYPVSVNGLPTASLTNLNTTICNGSIVAITGTLVATGNWTLTYSNGTRISGNGNSSIELDVTPTTSTIYNITSLEDSKCTSTSLSGTASVTVNPIPNAPIISSNTPICEGATLTFNTANVSGGTFSWTGVNGFSSSLQNPIITTATTAASGNYSATVTVLGCTSPSSTISATVNAIPNAPTITSNSPICEGANLTFSATAVPGGTFSWTGVNVFSSSLQNPTRATATTVMSGDYSATVTVLGCTSPSSTISATVNAIPNAPTITSNSPICEGANLTFSATAVPGGTFSWTGVNGFSSSLQNPIRATATTVMSGDYSATVTVLGCTSPSSTISATVNAIPNAPTITSNSPICEGANLTFNATSVSGGTFSWKGVNVFSSSLQNPTRSLATTASTGNYSATVTVLGCTSPSSTISATMNALPAKPTLTSQEICEGATATITGPTGVYTYTWQVPTGVATSTTSTVSTSKAGTYSLTITDANSCTSEVGTATVTVNALPTKPTLTSSTICEGQSTSVTMSLPAGTYTYTWQVPSGVATSTTNTVSTSKAGTYSLTITDVNSCSSEVGTATVVVHVLPAKPTLTSPTICEGETASITMLTPTGTNTYTYTWTVPTGVASSTTNTVSTSKAGTYSLTITDANSCTSEVGTGTVTVNPLPTLTITNPAAVCAPGTIDLTASTITAGSTASLTYTYFTNAIATSTLTNTSLIGTSGTYYIKGTSSFNCSAIKSVNTIINTIPSFNVLSPSVCVGAPLTIKANPLTGLSSDYNYTWLVPTGVANPGNVSSFTTTTAGVYTATIKNKSTTCESATLNNIVTFYPLPIAATIVATNNKVIANSTLNLTAAATGGTSPYRFTWVPNPSIYYSISGQENAVFTALKEGKVKFKYQVKDANNCEVNSAEYEITIDPADIVLVLPNAFTPNGDGNNDEFKIAATNTLGEKSFVYFEIYNRNGKLLTNKITDIKAGWNGRSLEGIMQDMGVYFVKLVKLNKDGQQVVETSPIYLLK